MEYREGWESPFEVFQSAINSQKRRQFTNLRVMVAEDSADGHTVTLQPVIKANVTDITGKVSQVSLPQLLDVPIHFAGGGGTTATHMVKKGDEGLASFSSMPFDLWHQQGGVQMQVDGRSHALSDASFHPGGRSDPRKLQQVSTDSHQIRSDDKKVVIDHHPTKGTRHKAVDPSTSAASETFDPFTQAKKFFEHLVHPSDGHASLATDGDTTHSVTNTHAEGPKLSAANGAHTVNAHPDNGVGIASSVAHTITAPNANLDKQGNLQAQKNITSSGGNISAPSGAISGLSGAFSSLSGPGGQLMALVKALAGSFASVSTGTMQATGAVGGQSLQTTQDYTVASLPVASSLLKGTRAHVVDASAPAFLQPLAGGGNVFCPVLCDGTRWVAA